MDRLRAERSSLIEEFVLSGYPHLEAAYRVGKGVSPVLRRRGLLAVEQEPALVG